MENKQTAVDFLEESIHLHCLINDSEDVMIDYNTLDKLFMKAKAMEKEQEQLARKESYNEGWLEATQYIFKKYKQEEDDKI